MADVRPFRGLLYNPQVVGELSDVICPPYDIISPQLQSALYQQSPYNMARLEEGEVLPPDTASDNRYTRAADTLQRWIRERILSRDEEPAYYLVRHGFNFRGSPRIRLGFIGGLRLEEYEKGVVLPHEYTERAAKQDRLALMEACHSNFSHIMALYRDQEGRLLSLFHQVMDEPPLFSFLDPEENTYALWRITDQPRIGVIHQAMSSMTLYIADGHHRYETALTFRDQQSSRQGAHDTDEAHNFAMAYLVDFGDPGLVVLPYHRVVGGLHPDALARLWERIDRLFTVKPFDRGPAINPEELLREVEDLGKSGQVLAVVRPDDSGASLIIPHPEAMPKEQGPISSFEAWILEEMVLKPVLGDSLSQHVSWIHNAREALEKLKDQRYQMLFLLRPLPMELFEVIIGRGERLPRKSTFFYPKFPAGLVINLLEDKI